MSEPEFVAQTLEWCNQRRAEHGMEPLERLPQGRISDPSECPCGKAIGLHVFPLSGYGDEDEYLPNYKPIPKAVHDFIIAFDNGELPQYEARR